MSRDLNHHDSMPEGEEIPPPGRKIAAVLRWAMLAVSVLAAAGTLSLSMGWIGSAARAEIRYHCPMHPTVVSDRPGDCPICGMDLVPIDEANADEHAHHDHGHGQANDYGVDIRAIAKQLGAKPGQWVCPMVEDGVVADEHGRCDKCGMALVQVPSDEVVAQEPAVYTCPMHPEVEQEGPGKCPTCGMHLVRRDPPGEGHPVQPPPGAGVPGLTEITIAPERLAKIGVRTAPVELGTLQGTVRTVGVVAADERKRAVVQTRFSGWIEELLVNETGARVKAGQPLVKIYSPEVYQAQIEYLNAVRWGEGLDAPAEERLRLLGVAGADLAALRKSGKAEPSMVLRAPSNGYVIQKGAVVGSYVSPGTVLFEVSDLSRVWVVADIYEQDIGQVKVGTKATFAASALPGDRFVGKVSFVYPVVDPSTRTMKVRLEIDNKEISLRPGMFGDVRLETPGRSGRIVSRDAVIETGDHVYTLVARGGGRFEPREVHILGRSGEHVLVEGVEAGEQVVTSAGFFIDSESRLRAALSGMGSAPAGHQHHAASADGEEGQP